MSGIQQMLLRGGSTDPYFSSVILLLDGQGTNGGTSFLDLSSYGHTMVASGATTSTAQKKWGSSSALNASSGGNNNRVYCNNFPVPNEFKFTTEEFTVEMWFYLTSIGVAQILAQRNGGSGSYPWQLYITAANKIGFRGYPAAGGSLLYNLLSTTTVTTGTWYFVQGRRTNGANAVFALAVGGTQEASASVAVGTALYENNDTINIGNYQDVGYQFPLLGYWQDFRLTRGVARTFALPTEAFPHS